MKLKDNGGETKGVSVRQRSDMGNFRDGVDYGRR